MCEILPKRILLMKESTSSSRDVRFGVFEVDLEAGQLLKDGQKVKLQGQPFQVLAMLLERSGQVVTREELQQRLWSADTFVDFDHGLNKAINKIREALGDSADSPRFVETLARRGYRFVAPVEQVGEHLSNSNLRVDKVRDAFVPSASPAELREVEKVERRTWTAGWTWAAVLTALILAGVGWFYFHRVVAPPMKVVRFTSYPGKEKDPALSPDGQRLAFAWDGESSDNFDIYVRSIGNVGELPLTAEKPLRLTSDPAADFSPTWSPDGRYLAFARVSAGNSAVYVMPSMGGQERKLHHLV
jgi:DNA-binding winged helix-turn-helix (wHTH) protein